MDTQQTVSAVVRFAMAMRRERQRELADALGITPAAVSHRLSGRTRWSVDDLDALAEHYGLEPGELVSPPSPLPAALDAPAGVRELRRRPRRLHEVTRKELGDTARPSGVDALLAA